ncbi:MAG: hypothetical protein ABIQ52_09435 [Vicinamibacterales bacterium]
MTLWCANQAHAADAPRRVAIQDPITPETLGRILSASGQPAIPMVVRVAVDLVQSAGTAPDSDVTTRLAEYEARGLQLWPVINLPDEAAAARWRTLLQEWLARHGEHVAVLELRVAEPTAVARFSIQTAATDLRATIPSARLAIGGAVVDPDRLARLIDASLAPYVDLIAASSAAAAARSIAALQPVAPSIKAALIEQRLPSDPDAARDRLVDVHTASLGSDVVIVAVDAEARVLEGAIAALRPLAPLLTGDVEAIDPGASSLTLTAAGQDVSAQIVHRLLLDNSTFGLYLIYTATEGSAPVDVAISVPGEGTPTVIDLARTREIAASGYRRDGQTVHLQAPRTNHPMLIAFNGGAGDVFVERSGVSAERLLSIEEIIARHRLQQASQDLRLRHYSAQVRMEQHFRPTVADPGYDVVTDNRYFSGPGGVEWEELSFSVNGSHWGANRPPFPLLQPEKVLSLPLQLRFGSDYRYRLDGVERVDGFDCYVVKFDPLDATRSLYRGTVWIERRGFARVKVQAVQTNLAAPVVSNEEIQRYRPVATGAGRPLFLFEGMTARQIVLIAGRNLLVEKLVRFSDFVVNAPDFDAARAAARAGDRIMYKDTERGLRYYMKQGMQRVVSDRPTQKVKAMAMGITVDPSFAFPLPIFGINYLNFAVGGRQDTQLAMLFAGVLAAVNVQRPKLGGTPFDASVDLFVIAVPSSDRVHDAQGERPGERVITWPETTGLNLGWQFTPFQKATFQYQFRFDGYHADTTTAETFKVPRSTLTNGFGGAYEYRRGGYSLTANGAWYRRAGWKPWGMTDTAGVAAGLDEPQPNYARYSAGLSKDLFLGAFQKLHFNGAYFGGKHLDRFSRYQFGLFDDTRIHGVPASGLRFDELAIARGSYTFNIFEQYRIDLFLERGSGRDRTVGRAWQSLTGTGVAVNVRAPFGTILRADIGHSFLPSRYRGIGSTVVQIMFLKPLGGP